MERYRFHCSQRSTKRCGLTLIRIKFGERLFPSFIYVYILVKQFARVRFTIKLYCFVFCYTKHQRILMKNCPAVSSFLNRY